MNPTAESTGLICGLFGLTCVLPWSQRFVLQKVDSSVWRMWRRILSQRIINISMDHWHRRLQFLISVHGGHTEHLVCNFVHLFGQFCDAPKQYVRWNKQNAECSHFSGPLCTLITCTICQRLDKKFPQRHRTVVDKGAGLTGCLIRRRLCPINWAYDWRSMMDRRLVLWLRGCNQCLQCTECSVHKAID